MPLRSSNQAAVRTEGTTKKLRTTTKPGQCISVDQLESPVAGFVGQNKGFFFRKRYKVATVFVDHFSRLSFVYLQESTKGDETLLAKRAFEAYAASFGVKVYNYHADNGRFAERLYLNHAKANGQTVSLCGVNAHFQNGIAEKRIRDFTACARTSLLHAMSRWPSAITIHLWPYALRFIRVRRLQCASFAGKWTFPFGVVLRYTGAPSSHELSPSILPSLRSAQRSSGRWKAA
jgi:hypothetical protein